MEILNQFTVETDYVATRNLRYSAMVSMVKPDGSFCSGNGFGHTEHAAISDAFYRFLRVAGKLGYLKEAPNDA